MRACMHACVHACVTDDKSLQQVAIKVNNRCSPIPDNSLSFKYHCGEGLHCCWTNVEALQHGTAQRSLVSSNCQTITGHGQINNSDTNFNL